MEGEGLLETGVARLPTAAGGLPGAHDDGAAGAAAAGACHGLRFQLVETEPEPGPEGFVVLVRHQFDAVVVGRGPPELQPGAVPDDRNTGVGEMTEGR